MAELSVGLPPVTESAPIAIAGTESTPKTSGSLREVIQIARESAQRNKKEGFFGKALKATREGIRGAFDLARGLPDPNVRGVLKSYIEQKSTNAKESFDGWREAKTEQFNQKREAAVMATRNKINEIGTGARDTAMGMWGVATEVGGAMNQTVVRPVAERAIGAAQSVGEAGMKGVRTVAEVGATGARMGIDVGRFFGDIAKELPNEAKRWGEAGTRYYKKADRAVETRLKAGSREMAAKWFDVLAKPKSAMKEAKFAMASWLAESAQKNHAEAEGRRTKASELRTKAAEIRNLGTGAAV